jgi:hypothetical protein
VAVQIPQGNRVGAQRLLISLSIVFLYLLETLRYHAAGGSTKFLAVTFGEVMYGQPEGVADLGTLD